MKVACVLRGAVSTPVGAVQKRRLELLSNAAEFEGAVFFTTHSAMPVALWAHAHARARASVGGVPSFDLRQTWEVVHAHP